MLIADLLGIAQMWKQPRYPSKNEWINKMSYIYLSEYFPGIKRNELSCHKTTWRHLKYKLLSGRSQFEEVTYCIISTVQQSGKIKAFYFSLLKLGREGMNSHGTDFQDSVTMLYNTVIVGTLNYTFDKPQRTSQHKECTLM